jgi:MYXO-CTERM domain-containing protein
MASLCVMSTAAVAEIVFELKNANGDVMHNYIGEQINGNPHNDIMSGEGWFWDGAEITTAGSGGLDGNPLTGTLAWNEGNRRWEDSGNVTGIEVGYALWWDADPFVFMSFSFQNNTGLDQEFFFSANNAIAPIVGDTQMGGSVTMSATDANPNGGPAVGPVTGPLYRALVDGVGVQDMIPAGTMYNYPAAGGSLTTGVNSFGLPGLTVDGPDNPLLSIGLQHKVFIGNGDRITMNSSFVLESDDIPAPGAIALLGIAGIAGRRRRRS